jgi:hypothetical protein
MTFTLTTQEIFFLVLELYLLGALTGLWLTSWLYRKGWAE